LNKNYKFPYWGPFVLETTAEQEFLSILREKGNESRDKNLDCRSELAGVIDHEYYYEDYNDWFIPKFSPYIDLYNNILKSTWKPNSDINQSWSIPSLWINYQKSNEYNPPHDHTGDLSFIIYLQVPDEIKDEYEISKDQRKNAGPGTINFDFGVELPYSISSVVRFPSAGDIFIFPSWLKHFVDPFKSDVERISVSGNLLLNK
tara:strand:+ start:210 stop:818 length:609 start_codon:yes stop_codon:yes gene_type:complete